MLKKRYIVLLTFLIILIAMVLKVVQYRSLEEISISDLKKIKISNNEKIYICRLTQTTGPEWAIVGDKNGLFGENIIEELVIIKGYFLPLLFRNKLEDGANGIKYVIVAKQLGKEKYTDSDPEFYRVIKAKKWYLLKDN